MLVGVVQSRHAFVGGTVSTSGRWRVPETKGRKGIRNADQALTVRGEHADRIVGSPNWWSSINYNRSMPENLKLSQIGSSLLPPPFRVLHSPWVRKHCVKLSSTVILSRLDYCNSLLAGLQHIQNSAARLVLRKPRRESATPFLKTLHWLPVKARIEYKVPTLCYQCLNSVAMPSYLCELL